MDKLAFYKVSVGGKVGSLQLGTWAGSSSDDIVLRIANDSDLYQAKDVVVSCQDSAAGRELWLSLDGDNYHSSIEVGDIPPGGLSRPFTLRRASPSDAGNGTKQATLTATPGSWSNPIDTSTSDDYALDTE